VLAHSTKIGPAFCSTFDWRTPFPESRRSLDTWDKLAVTKAEDATKWHCSASVESCYQRNLPSAQDAPA